MKSSMELTLAMILFSMVAVSRTVSSVSANPFWRPWEEGHVYATIDVASPIAGGFYASNDTWLNFTVAKTSDWTSKTDSQIKSVAYSVDGYYDGVADEKETVVEVNVHLGDVNPPSNLSFSFDLPGLKEGKHTVEVWVNGIYENEEFNYSSWSYPPFFVDDGVPPLISLVSAEKKTYSTQNIPLTYQTNEQVVSVMYYMDGHFRDFLSGNTTLTGVSEGTHTIEVYAHDEAGNDASDSVTFTVSLQPVAFSIASPPPVVLISALASVGAIVGIILIICVKKNKGAESP